MQGDSNDGQQKPRPRSGGDTRRGTHACEGRRPAGSLAGVLCGGDKGDAKVGDGIEEDGKLCDRFRVFA